MESENKKIRLVALFVKENGRLNTSWGSYTTTYDDVVERFRDHWIGIDAEWLRTHHEAIALKLKSYVCVERVYDSHAEDDRKAVDGWDVNYYLNYCPQVLRD